MKKLMFVVLLALMSVASVANAQANTFNFGAGTSKVGFTVPSSCNNTAAFRWLQKGELRCWTNSTSVDVAQSTLLGTFSGTVSPITGESNIVQGDSVNVSFNLPIAPATYYVRANLWNTNNEESCGGWSSAVPFAVAVPRPNQVANLVKK